MFRPKLFDTLRDYSWKKFAKDGLAGLIVGIVALPLAIAFAIASGVAPEKGIFTAVVAGFIISAFGGSRVQIGGPTGAFVVIVYGIVHNFGINGLLIATLMAGVILIIFGLAKLGSIIKYIPHSVILGFTFGIAILIFTSQISDFLGLGLANLPPDFVDKLEVIFRNMPAFNGYACAIALGTIAISLLLGRVTKRVPGSLVALLLSSAVVYAFNLPVETIGSRFGDIPHALPRPVWPDIDFRTFRSLLNPAFTIAMLGAIESLLSAAVADGMIGGRHRSNMELVAQGAANIVSPLFGGIPATGAIARTATNVKNGGRTPVAGIVHAVVLLLIMLFLGRLVVYIPLACLAGVLMVVAYHMSEWKSVLSIVKLSRGSALVTVMTFALTILVDLTAAIEIGLILSTFVFIRNMSIHTTVSFIESVDNEKDDSEPDFADAEKSRVMLPKNALLYEITGPMFFGAVYKFREALSEISKPPRVIVLQMRQVPVVDSSGVHVLHESFRIMRKRGTEFILCGMQSQVEARLDRGGLIELVGRANVVATLDEATARAKALCAEKIGGAGKLTA